MAHKDLLLPILMIATVTGAIRAYLYYAYLRSLEGNEKSSFLGFFRYVNTGSNLKPFFFVFLIPYIKSKPDDKSARVINILSILCWFSLLLFFAVFFRLL